MTRFAWTRSVGLILALALPLSACDAAPDKVCRSTAAGGTGAAPEASAPKPPFGRRNRTDGGRRGAGGEMPRRGQPVQIAQAPAADAESEPFQEGKDYFRFAVAQPTSSPPDQVEVAEAFMYSCPHCFAFEPEIARWVAHKPPG